MGGFLMICATVIHPHLTLSLPHPPVASRLCLTLDPVFGPCLPPSQLLVFPTFLFLPHALHQCSQMGARENHWQVRKTTAEHWGNTNATVDSENSLEEFKFFSLGLLWIHNGNIRANQIMMLPLAHCSSFLINVTAGYNGQMNFKFLPTLRFHGW